MPRHKKIFFTLFAFLCSWVGVMGMAMFGLLLYDFLFPVRFHEYNSWQVSGMQIDILLILLFGLQHSLMARKSFKEKWKRLIPPELERSVYVLFSGFFLFLIATMWVPVWPILYDLRGTPGGYVLIGGAGLGTLVMLWSLLHTDALDLVGLRTLILLMQEKKEKAPVFTATGPYRYVRHPLYLGMLLMFGSTPALTPDHLIFFLCMTLYILVGISFEERDLSRVFGGEYDSYKEQVPMLIPVPGRHYHDS